jgi:agmatinase
MPATGTPEPGGLSWRELITLMKLVMAKKTVVAADVVELSPIPGFVAPNFLAARLVYKLIGYKFCLA